MRSGIKCCYNSEHVESQLSVSSQPLEGEEQRWVKQMPVVQNGVAIKKKEHKPWPALAEIREGFPEKMMLDDNESAQGKNDLKIWTSKYLETIHF